MLSKSWYVDLDLDLNQLTKHDLILDRLDLDLDQFGST